MIGIFPVTYVEIIPGADPSVTPLGTLKSMKSGTGSAVGTTNTYIQEGQGKAKFNFQVTSHTMQEYISSVWWYFNAFRKHYLTRSIIARFFIF